MTYAKNNTKEAPAEMASQTYFDLTKAGHEKESADFQWELVFWNSHEVMKNNPGCLGYTKGMKFRTQLYRDYNKPL